MHALDLLGLGYGITMEGNYFGVDNMHTLDLLGLDYGITMEGNWENQHLATTQANLSAPYTLSCLLQSAAVSQSGHRLNLGLLNEGFFANKQNPPYTWHFT